MSRIEQPWLILDLQHSEDDAPWVEQVLVQRGLEGWEVHQEYPEVKWRLYFPLEGEHEARLAELKQALDSAGSQVSESGHIRDEDWAENWKEFYHPFPVGNRFVVCPSWEQPDAEMSEGREIISLDPGSAFGTGYHESTRLCLQLMEKLETDPLWGKGPVLDYGTGSGILAIGALHLGCPKVVASDRDPLAVAVARDNLQESGFAPERFEVRRDDVPQPAADNEEGLYPFVIANLTADILAQLSLPLSSVCGRHLVLGGIVEKRAQKVEDAFTSAGGKKIERIQENDWVAYHFLFEKNLNLA
ncbi:MAG: 50S ribosomal protein L11 methyltransferase [Candidatus Eremiobacteraeota bacterium]|nr:50S ribosomal protein L11 methyltransferase [Candidatus Eremiobacteraeota bacterium]